MHARPSARTKLLDPPIPPPVNLASLRATCCSRDFVRHNSIPGKLHTTLLFPGKPCFLPI
eukprot:2948862-Alexandrium_andersonii.AAC.1